MNIFYTHRLHYMTKRGSNEIPSYLLDYFTEVDERKVEEVDLFRDGCAGQNRNSVLPVMAVELK